MRAGRPRRLSDEDRKRNKERARAIRQRDYHAPFGGAYVSVSTRPPDDVLAEAEQRNQTAYPSLTAQLCGDPKPEQSALGRMPSSKLQQVTK